MFNSENSGRRMRRPNKRGPLVKVKLGHGRFVKMYQADAEAQGLEYEPEAKMRTPLRNKMVEGPEVDKAAEELIRKMEREAEMVGLDELTDLIGGDDGDSEE